MKIKNLISFFSLLILLSPAKSLYSQSSDSESNIVITPYLESQIESITPIVQKNLTNKLNQIVTLNGLGGDRENSRFVITSNINVLEKNITPTAPPMVAITLDISFYIGDGVEGNLYAVHSITTKGVGTNDTKAYTMALNAIKPKNSEYAEFISDAKTKIVQYYESKCGEIITESKNKSSRGLYDEAIHQLLEVPSVSKECYEKALNEALKITGIKLEATCQSSIAKANAAIESGEWDSAISQIRTYTPNLKCYPQVKELYSKIADGRCTSILAKAKSEWSNNNYDASARYLAEISTSSTCGDEADKLLTDLKSSVDEKEQREWDLAYEKYNRDQTLVEKRADFDREMARREMDYKENQGFEIRKAEIQAARDIGVAYGENQPKKVTYNIKGWW